MNRALIAQAWNELIGKDLFHVLLLAVTCLILMFADTGSGVVILFVTYVIGIPLCILTQILAIRLRQSAKEKETD